MRWFAVIVYWFVSFFRFWAINYLGEEYKLTFDYHWIKFKTEYSKSYDTMKEELHRYTIFQKNLQQIDKHNEQYEAGLVSWSMGVNQFSDIANHEHIQCDNSYVIDDYNDTKITRTHEVHKLKGITPDSIDWRDFDAVRPVRSQLSCCSSYAMAAVGAIEGQNAIRFNKKYSISPQELIDCSVPYHNKMCYGGSVANSFRYAMAYGLSKESEYPYKAKDGNLCNPPEKAVYVENYRVVQKKQQYLLNALGTVGPVVALISTDKLLGYKSGIFECSSNVRSSGSFVLLVGYGKMNHIPYWIIKMSWGPKWGENGYLRIRRSKYSSQCGLLTKMCATYPIL